VILAELSRRLGCRLEGDEQVDVTRVAGIEDAGPGDLTFLSNPKYASKLATTRASAILVDETTTGAPCPMLHTPEVYLAFADAVAILMPAGRPTPGISPLAAIDPAAAIGADVYIGPFAVVGAGARVGARTVVYPHAVLGANVVIGEDCDIHSGVSIREGATIGARVVLQDGVVIGGDGYGFARRRDGTHRKIPQVGRVVIEDDVEIGANTTVDRPAVGETRVGRGTKIDNLVQIAHGVKIGRNVLLAAQVGIAGSTVLGDDVVMAGQSGATGHVRLGQGVIVGAKSAVTKDIPAGAHVTGIPAGDVAEWRELTVLSRRLPDLRRTVADLEARLAALEGRLKGETGA
jgi:UDP-3-O-[3-hydroxymyristoyl] glucosamine N-acyltransferase